MILCVGATPAAQRVMVFPQLTLDAVNRAATTLDGAAGKAVNVGKVLAALGAEVVVTGFLGGDRGAYLSTILRARGMTTDFIEVPATTRECVTVIDQKAGTVTELVEESRPIPAVDYDRLLEIIARRVSACQAVVLSGTVTPGGPADFYARCTRLAKAAGALAVVDAQGPLLLETLASGPDVVKPNRTELGATLGRSNRDEMAALETLGELQRRGARRVVVTAGKEPTLALEGQQAWRIYPPEIQPVNPIGSGDAFTAAMVWKLTQGKELGEACRWGAAAGAANALTLMAGEVKLEDVQRLAQQVRIEKI